MHLLNLLYSRNAEHSIIPVTIKGNIVYYALCYALIDVLFYNMLELKLCL